MNSNTLHIRHGFTGQRLAALPFFKIEAALENPLTSDLVIHSMGYFPNAEHHYIQRDLGCGEYLLIYCVKGEGWFHLNDNDYEVKENSFFVLPANRPHIYGSGESNPWYIYWVHFKGIKAPAIYNAIGEGVHLINVDDHSRIEDRKQQFDEILNLLEGTMSSEVVDYVNMSFSHLIASFIYVNEYKQAKYSIGKEKNSFFVSKATHYMSENIQNKLSLSMLAQHFGYSESHFYRIFLRETNYTPINYFIHIKIDYASQLLISTTLKVNQIALKLGFEDPYYFSKLFKKIKGVSPKAYREEAKGF